MRKRRMLCLSLLMASVLALSCGIFNFSGKFSPPTWIQGTWSDTYSTTTYIFETENVKQTIGGYTINLGLAYLAATITETSNDSLYEFSIDQSDEIATYRFEKTSATTLDYTVTASEVTSPVVVLTKQ
ncbi:MAG: hypothetical protein JXR21_01805 [Candidatus Marinimicrobia bacterium]|nr:hypothetical protein [Candidatus Neomarinimicrobiota bacterium]